MKYLVSFTLILGLAAAASSQTDLQKMVDTEQAFARLAAEKGTRAAFLANMADNAVIFNPDMTPAKPFWTARGESKSLLSWAPNYADVASDGKFGYTTGNWEFRAKGKDDPPGAFGEFITLWTRQPDGKYRFLIDIGVSHDKPHEYSTEWATARPENRAAPSSGSFEKSISDFASLASKASGDNAFAKYLADDVRLYREDRLPFLNKITSLIRSDSEVGKLQLETPVERGSSGNLAYILRRYKRIKSDKSVETGNSFQMWKFRGGKWQIVLDIMKPVPSK